MTDSPAVVGDRLIPFMKPHTPTGFEEESSRSWTGPACAAFGSSLPQQRAATLAALPQSCCFAAHDRCLTSGAAANVTAPKTTSRTAARY